QLADRGARRVVVVPAMLMAAGHVKNDVPSELNEARSRHPGVSIHMAKALDLHPALLDLCRVRYLEAIDGRNPVSPERSLLLLVGRGTTDPDANANIARVSRFLWESYGVGWASVAYSGIASPNVDEALTVCRRLGFDRIVVQPYFLFDGVLVKRIHEAVASHVDADPDVEIVTTGHFRSHSYLIDAFEDRAHEAIHGTPHMNCDLCKYRVRLHGREADLGAPQAGHHHHVRASGDPEHDHDHNTRPRRSGRRLVVPQREVLADHPWDERLLERLRLAQ
ncbi:sirohydrochlorin chelatase, partial [Singulisphaera rosea]